MIRIEEPKKNLKDEIDGLLEQENLKWRQHAKEDWLRNGDRNTKYFHTCARQRKRRNSVEQIRDEEGHLYPEPTDIEAAFASYYI